MTTQTTLVTGFLGSGKTTTLLHLLSQKPSGEKWAILVNEFGEIGVDGALLADSGATLKEVPGGCLCCVNGLPLQIGLNTLLTRNQPDRLLIEPTGLGHPAQILALLASDTYQNWLSLRAALRLLGNHGWRRALNQGEGYFACGWIVDSETQFDTLGLLE